MIHRIETLWAYRWGRALLILVAFALLYLFFWLTLPVWEGLLALLRLTLPVWSGFLIALLLAYLLDPVVAWLDRHGLPRGAGIAGIGLLLVALLAGLWLLGVNIAADLSEMVAQLPGLVEGLQEAPFLVARFVDPSYGTVFDEVFVTVHAWSERLVESVLPSLEGVDASGVTEQIVAVAGGGLQVSVIVVLTIFFLVRFGVYRRSILTVVPERHRGGVREVASELGYAVGGYIRGQLLIALFVGVMSYIGFLLIGIPLAHGLGFLAGLLNLVPFFGPILVAIPSVLIALTVGWPQAIGALVVLILVNQIDAHVLSPIIFSRTVEIDPATIILAIFLGTVLFGLLGAILAVPAAVMARFFYRRNYLESAWYRGGPVLTADTEAERR